MASKGVFATALLLCGASWAIQSPLYAQEVRPSEDSNIDYGLVARTENKTNFAAPGNSSSVSRRPGLPDPLPPSELASVSTKVGAKRSVLQSAYRDAFKILAGANKCSDFLGGTGSIAALNELVSNIGTTTMRRSVAMQMSGQTITYQSHLTGFTYRMFEKATLNVDGLFFRGNGVGQPKVPSIGGFSPNTREARVTVLLHELGHLIRGSDKRWLLPDDGESEVLSVANTDRILEACRRTIKQVVDEN